MPKFKPHLRLLAGVGYPWEATGARQGILSTEVERTLMDFDPVNKSCSFCGIRGTPQTKFAGGLGAMICADCLAFYSDVFSSPRKSQDITRPPWDEMSDIDILGKLPMIADTVAQVDDFLTQWVQLARSRKLSWAEIGKALGVSRQAAWERYSSPKKDEGSAAG